MAALEQMTKRGIAAPNTGLGGDGGGGGGGGSGAGGGSPLGSGAGQGGSGQGNNQGPDTSGVDGINQASQDFQKQLADMTKGFQSTIQGLNNSNDNYLKQLQEASSLQSGNADAPIGEPYVSQIVDSIAQLNGIQQQYYQVLAGVYSPPVPRLPEASSSQVGESNLGNVASAGNGSRSGPLAQAMGAEAVEGDPISKLGQPGSRLPAGVAFKEDSGSKAYNPPEKR